MGESVDTLAREQIRKTQNYAQEIASALWGDNVRRDNGLRSVVREHDNQIVTLEAGYRELRSELRHYLDSERIATCHGLKALEEHKSECVDLYTEKVDGETDVKVAQIAAAGQVASAREGSKGAIAREWIVLAGIVFIALKDVLIPLIGGKP